MPKRLALLGWLVALAAMLPLPAAAQDPCEQAGNLTFNCQFASFGDAPGGQVGQGWWPFVVSGHPAFDQSTESPLAPAQRIWSDGEGFVAGIYQQVTGVTPGATYQAYVGWFVFQSAGPEMGRSIGIDPNGGTDPNSAAIVWSPEVWEKKRLAPELLARAVANGSAVTVFLRVNHPKTYGADQAFLDAVSLVRDDSVAVVDAEPTATQAPVPTATELPTATPVALPDTPTLVPTATETAATATPPPTATEAPAATLEPAATATAPSTPAPTAESAVAATAAPSPEATEPAATATAPVATPTAVPAPSATPTATEPAPAATAWDLRGGTVVSQVALAAAFAPPAPAASVPLAEGERPWWPYAVVALALVAAAIYGVARFSTGGRKRG